MSNFSFTPPNIMLTQLLNFNQLYTTTLISKVSQEKIHVATCLNYSSHAPIDKLTDITRVMKKD